jgi:hypothetical protein
VKQSESIAKLAGALVKAQGELRAITKDGTNPHFKSKFATLDAIIAEVRPSLAANGLAVIQGATTPHTTESGIVTAFTVETMLVHESGEWVLSAVVMPIIKADPQGAGAAITYGRRYGISALLSLATEEDDDGNAASQRSGAKGSRRAAERSTTATTQPAVTASSTPLNQRTHMPFGESKGTPIADMPVENLIKATAWARANKPEKYAEFIDAADLVIEDKSVAAH